MPKDHSDPNISQKLIQELAKIPIESAHTITIPVSPSGDNIQGARQYLHVRIKRTLYYFRGDYFAEGFWSESSDPNAPRGNRVPAEYLELHVKIEDPAGFEHIDREENTTYNSFTKVYYGTSDDYTRHRFIVSATSQMPSGWIPRTIATGEAVIER